MEWRFGAKHTGCEELVLLEERTVVARLAFFRLLLGSGGIASQVKVQRVVEGGFVGGFSGWCVEQDGEAVGRSSLLKLLAEAVVWIMLVPECMSVYV